ncbi:MAG: Scr1 family TA system antitoxin-like transcriptional regulator, partial [Patescibacteria group bacterium]
YEQILHLIDLSELPYIRLHILPRLAPLSWLLVAGSVATILYDFAAAERHSVVCIEDHLGAIHSSDNPFEVESYTTAFNDLDSRALSTEASVAFMRDAALQVLRTGNTPGVQ